MIAPKLVLISLIAGMLSACVSSGEDDLQQWMANERAQTKPRVMPISEPKKFEPQAYVVASEVDPFNSLKLVQALKRDSSQTGANASLIAPEHQAEAAFGGVSIGYHGNGGKSHQSRQADCFVKG